MRKSDRQSDRSHCTTSTRSRHCSHGCRTPPRPQHRQHHRRGTPCSPSQPRQTKPQEPSTKAPCQSSSEIHSSEPSAQARQSTRPTTHCDRPHRQYSAHPPGKCTESRLQDRSTPWPDRWTWSHRCDRRTPACQSPCFRPQGPRSTQPRQQSRPDPETN